MNVVVPDASILLKWVLPNTDEEDQEQAFKIRDGARKAEYVLKVPSLWLYEIGNILSIRLPKQAKSLIESLSAFILEEQEWSDVWLDKTLFLARHYGVTFYDAAYHGLAIVENGVFITADKKYVLKTKRIGNIMALSEWD